VVEEPGSVLNRPELGWLNIGEEGAPLWLAIKLEGRATVESSFKQVDKLSTA